MAISDHHAHATHRRDPPPFLPFVLAPEGIIPHKPPWCHQFFALHCIAKALPGIVRATARNWLGHLGDHRQDFGAPETRLVRHARLYPMVYWDNGNSALIFIKKSRKQSRAFER